MVEHVKLADSKSDQENLADFIERCEEGIKTGKIKQVNLTFFGFSLEDTKKFVSAGFWAGILLFFSAVGFGFVNLEFAHTVRWISLGLAFFLIIYFGGNLKQNNALKSFQLKDIKKK